MIILYIILAIIILIFGTALIIRKDYSIQRETVINKSKQEVFEFIKLLRNQDHYNKWWTMDPNAKKEFKGTDGSVGFVASWDSQDKRAGKGEQEIKEIRDGERIDYEIRFEKPFKGVANTHMALDSISSNQTQLIWVFRGRNKYPMNLMNLFTEKLLGGDLQTSITDLKKIIEK